MGDDRISKALVCFVQNFDCPKFPGDMEQMDHISGDRRISRFSLYIFCDPVDHTCFSFAVSGIF